MGGKKSAKQFFQKHTNSADKKCWVKIAVKKCEKKFFIFKLMSLPKNGGKKRAKHFSINARKVRTKNVGKKIVVKSAKKVFYIHTNVVTKKMGEKNVLNIFP